MASHWLPTPPPSAYAVARGQPPADALNDLSLPGPALAVPAPHGGPSSVKLPSISPLGHLFTPPLEPERVRPSMAWRRVLTQVQGSLKRISPPAVAQDAASAPAGSSKRAKGAAAPKQTSRKAQHSQIERRRRTKINDCLCVVVQ